MAFYIAVTIGAVGFLAAVPLVLYWERQDERRRR
jgi:hypothetical protein